MRTNSRRKAKSSTGAWIAALLALAPLSAMFYAVRITGIGIGIA